MFPLSVSFLIWIFSMTLHVFHWENRTLIFKQWIHKFTSIHPDLLFLLSFWNRKKKCLFFLQTLIPQMPSCHLRTHFKELSPWVFMFLHNTNRDTGRIYSIFSKLFVWYTSLEENIVSPSGAEDRCVCHPV